ncbi:recombinase family protein [Sphingobium sp. AS12]|uniref:recombinase family protein n=1 Tax=Sphingobium sp. AS12 TaxID=2849495 RepID=UPI001C317422|nr:recombinase family protein [Sphingobium sp. AS12]MBV2147496.1 recombinase family protein [Sphingobium sp. AS12]
MTQPAWIYARFSSLEQSKGHSLERQINEGRAFIERMGWEHSDQREIVDEGKSAFHGANRSEGSLLYGFEQKAREGHFSNGAVLAVENLDRLTRQGYEEAVELLRSLTMSGVTVATWHDNQTYEANTRIDMMKVMSIILKAELAREESEKKSIRIKASWTKKIDAAINGDRRALTKILPAWLTRDDTTHEMLINPYRAAVVNEIFDWYIEGRGLPSIVQRLNERREASWAYGIKDRGQGWNTAYLHKILTNRAVIGEFEPMSRPRSVIHEMTKGIIVQNFYPQIVTAEKFNRVQQLRAQRAKWGGQATKTMNNLLSGIAKCSTCGGAMYFESQQKVGRRTGHKLLDGSPSTYVAKTDRSYYRCNSARRGHTCTNKTRIRYETLEKSILDAMFDLAMKDSTFKPSDKVANLTIAIAELDRSIATKREQMQRGSDNLLEVFSKSLAQRVAQLEAEVDADETQLAGMQKELEIERGSLRPEEDTSLLLAARTALGSEDKDERYLARVQTHQSLTRLIDQMFCDSRGETHVTLNNSDVYVHIAPDGRTTAVVHEGPDGERDWNPDQEAAE